MRIRKTWTGEEIDFLKKYADLLSTKEISSKLNRNINSVYGKLEKLHLIKKYQCPWTNEEVSFLIDNYSKLSITEISKHLNKTAMACMSKAGKLNLFKKPKIVYIKPKIFHYRWKDSKLKFLIHNYSNMTASTISKHVSMPLSLVNSKLQALGLIKSKVVMVETEKLKELIR